MRLLSRLIQGQTRNVRKVLFVQRPEARVVFQSTRRHGEVCLSVTGALDAAIKACRRVGFAVSEWHGRIGPEESVHRAFFLFRTRTAKPLVFDDRAEGED